MFKKNKKISEFMNKKDMSIHCTECFLKRLSKNNPIGTNNIEELLGNAKQGFIDKNRLFVPVLQGIVKLERVRGKITAQNYERQRHFLESRDYGIVDEIVWII